ncbi:diguanylate cyclase domain-containing protein [Pseudidiomarina sediminum]|uniref:bifunctional diguanylate cyclase/phosphodiesterase n=1 Tax=Pseudidiomarina sediminum TaxID=431675 RepID=UPI001C93D408|nr:diguanylate cyclase [Pseudidiomarina sediminum]MBY6064073.1 diguanylate cyclase [Pseudidiomarina sediminum]
MANEQQPTTQTSEIARLRKAVVRLKSLALKYRQSEVVQKALFRISELASSARDMSEFYPAVHAIIDELMVAKNFFVCLYDAHSETVKFVYFVDEYDAIPDNEQFPAEVLRQGLTGYVMRTGEPFLLVEQNYGALVAAGEIVDLGAKPEDWLGVPLRSGDQVIGAMVVQSYSPDVGYSVSDKELFMFVSQHIVNALERIQQRELMRKEIDRQTADLRDINRNLEEQIVERQRAEKLSAVLYAISELTNTSENMAIFFQRLHEQIGLLMNNDNFFVALLDDERQHIHFPYHVDQRDCQLMERRPLGKGLTEYVIATRKPVFIDQTAYNTLLAEGAIDGPRKSYGTRSIQWLGSPLVVDDEVIGVLSVQTYTTTVNYKPDDLELLNFVSHHVAVALERRRNADEIRRVNAFLEKKVAERTEELVNEIEHRKKIEEKLFYDAHHDTLTGLPNRSMFTDRLQQALGQKRRFPSHNFAVLFVDLDRFKNINDTLGHSAGDEFLLEASRRIGTCVRENDTVARLGGDEFVILLNLISHIEDAKDVASRIIELMRKPFVFGETEHYSGASVGIAECKSRNDTAERLLRDADAAMYQAKNMGRGRFVVFDESIHQDLVASLHRETELRHAQFDQDFVLLQHPIASFTTTQSYAFEIAVRWQRGEQLVDAQSFLNVAEKTGMILQLDHWLLMRICELIREQSRVLPVCVTLSTRHLYKLADVKALLDIVTQAGIAPQQLILGFSETELSDHSKRQLSSLRMLADAGVGLALTEFGRSAGALQYLLNYPFNHVKLDPRIVNETPHSERARVMVKNVVNLCDELAITIAAAGIDTAEQRDALGSVGVQLGCGKQFGEPAWLPSSAQQEVI